MKNKILAIFTVLMFITPVSCLADGNWLLEHCSAALLIDSGQTPDDASAVTKAVGCVGFIRGIRDTATIYQSMSKDNMLVCIPDETRTDQLTKVIVKFLQDNPQHLNRNEAILALRALKDAYPCR